MSDRAKTMQSRGRGAKSYPRLGAKGGQACTGGKFVAPHCRGLSFLFACVINSCEKNQRLLYPFVLVTMIQVGKFLATYAGIVVTCMRSHIRREICCLL